MKPFVTVSLRIHGYDSPFEIADYVDGNGRFVNIGSQAVAQLERGDAVHFVAAEGTEIIIPYHAIVAYSVTKEEGEFTPAEDAFCKSAEQGTTTAVVGTAIVGTSTVG